MTARRFRRVLVGWDGSADAIDALSAAASIAGGDGGHVVALAVLTPAPSPEVAGEGVSAREAISRLADDQFGQARLTAPDGVRMSLRIVESEKIGRTVCGYATEHGFDLLVIGRHGDGGVLHPRLGRVADAAVRGCAIPVLLM
ncbi:MAG TPA: universal stress protein [Streptosporangiaceae bacterium]|nr:universal stress protein [Streptosporangiaceae bacterium]